MNLRLHRPSIASGLHRLRRWFLDPFTVKIDIHDHTRVEHRAFPYRLRLQAVESVQEIVDRGDLVLMPAGTIHLTETIRVSKPTSIFGGHLLGHGHVTCFTVEMGE